MYRRTKQLALVWVGCVIGLLASAAQADSVFDFTGPDISPGTPLLVVPSSSGPPLSVDVTAYGNIDTLTPGLVSRDDALGGLGVNSGDVFVNQIDTMGGKEALIFTFLSNVVLESFTFDAVDAQEDVSLRISTAGNEVWTGRLFTTGVALGPDSYRIDVAGLPGLASASSRTSKVFYVSAVSNDDFVISGMDVTAVPLPVPLPAAVWCGLGLLGLVGVSKLRQARQQGLLA